MAESLIKAKVGSDGTINNDELHKATTQLKYEKEADHERNIPDMTQVDDYKSDWKDKDATTVNDSAYTFLNSFEDEISDWSKHVEASKEPITDTYIVKRVRNLLDGTISVNSTATVIGIIGPGECSIAQGMISGVTSTISSNVITDILTDYSKMILKSNSFPLKPLKSKTLVIAPKTEPFLSCDRNIRASIEIGDSRIDHGRIGTPFVNKNIWSGDDNFSV